MSETNTPSVSGGRYNPLKDSAFWVAFVLGGGPVLLLLFASGFAFEAPVIVNLAFTLAWMAWIVIRKGGKGSLLIGFIIGLLAAGAAFYLTVVLGQ